MTGSIGIARLLIIFATALAVPLQGVASVTAAQCMVLGHHDMADRPAAGQSDHVAGDDGQMASHSHPDEGSRKKTGHHCGPCVACCLSVSIVAAALPIVSPLAPDAAIIEMPYRSHPSVLPDELDRPPLAL